MMRKTPSSLDYQALLHELAITNWRRALLGRDFSKARENAERLTRSTERMWKGIGHSILAVTELSCGFRHAALSALELAERCCVDVPGLVTTHREHAAYLMLESGEPARALERSASGSLWRGVALARLGHSEEAKAVARALAPRSEPLAAYLRWELGMGGIASLEHAVGSLIAGRAAVYEPVSPIRFELARALEAEGRRDESAAMYEEIVTTPDGLLHWPIPHVRSHFRRACLYRDSGDMRRAHQADILFLSYWQGGELDRDEVAEARQRVSS